ncbi:MAG: abortive infection system antitoxin AbiGi family protein [Cyclobacteriaceae bacterium]
MKKLSYIDDLYGDGTDLIHAFPIVCFCDIPNNLQDNHKENFGPYGIGLTKTWGIKNYLSPVIYTHKNSIISGNLKFFLNWLANEDNLQEDDRLGLRNHISYQLMSHKAYEGYKFIKEEKSFEVEELTRFYDEREWRYLPLNCNGLKLWLNESEFKSEEILKRENQRIQDCNRLEFQISDIEYLILKGNSEINPFLSELSIKYFEEKLKRIKEKIIIN